MMTIHRHPAPVIAHAAVQNMPAAHPRRRETDVPPAGVSRARRGATVARYAQTLFACTIIATGGCGGGRDADVGMRALWSDWIARGSTDWERSDSHAGTIIYHSIEHHDATLAAADAATLAHNPYSIFLRRLDRLDEATAQELARSSGSLHFDGLGAISSEAARALARHRCLLRLDAVVEIDAETAAGLARHEGSLSLDGLTSIDSATAEVLGSHRGFLSLNGLEELSEPVARGLAEHRGILCLNGVQSLSTPAARALARHRFGLYLGGVTAIEAEAIEAISEHRGFELVCGLQGGSANMAVARLRDAIRRPVRHMDGAPDEQVGRADATLAGR